MIVVSSSAFTRWIVPGCIRNAAPGRDDLRVRHLSPGVPISSCARPEWIEPGLVLLPVELEAERLAGLDEQNLSAVVVGQRPDQLVAPGLLDLRRLDRELRELAEVRRVAGDRIMPVPPPSASRDSRGCARPRRAGPSACSRSARGPRAGTRRACPRPRALGRSIARGRRARGGARAPRRRGRRRRQFTQCGSFGDSSKPSIRSSSASSTTPKPVGSGATTIVAAPPCSRCAASSAARSASISSSPFNA